jgi:hypothetical protein
LELEHCRNKPKNITIESKGKIGKLNKIKEKENVFKDNTDPKSSFFDIPKNKEREFNEEDLEKFDEEENKEEMNNTGKKERPTNSKYKDNLDLNETSGGFFKTSISKEGKSQAQINREKEIAADTNLIEEGSEGEADLSKEIAKLEGNK